LVVVVALAGCGRLGFQDRSATSDGDTDSAGTADVALPVTGWTRVSAGDETTCGIDKSRAYCWGRGSNNEIGDGNATNRPSPTEVALPTGSVTDIVQGEGHGCAVVDDAVYCWGLAAIGNGNPTAATPRKVTLSSGVTSISAGGGFACATAGGNLYCWGDDPSGALGNGAAGATLVPQRITLPASAVAVDAGNDHAMAMISDGRVYVWGHNDNGVFGNGPTAPASSDVPVEITSISGTLPVLAGWHACVLVAGAVSCWGTGTRGELGDGQMMDRPTPGFVTGMMSGVTALAVGGGPVNHDATCAVNGGAATCWGSGIYGRLGTGTMSDQSLPQPVQSLPADIVELALGFEHTCARSSDGSVRCWGRGDLGQLGDGQSANSLTPVDVPLPP
jgi:alpha-tubulin suppressor-like RCC1 family protein